MHRAVRVVSLLAWVALLLSGCAREYEGTPPEFSPVRVIVPPTISTTEPTTVTFSECIVPDGLDVRLVDAESGDEALLTTITGPVSEWGCVTEATFTPAYALSSGFYRLTIESPALRFTTVLEATATFTFAPGVYLMVHGGPVLDGLSEVLRTWFVEFGEPDDDGTFDIWHVDADPPEEGGEPVCLGWSAQPVSEGRGIGWHAHTRGVLNEDGDRFDTAEGFVLNIDVVPLVCVRGGRYTDQIIPTGDFMTGLLKVDHLEIPCGAPTGVDHTVYTGQRCPDDTVLPHE